LVEHGAAVTAQQSTSLAVIILTHNEAANLPACLASLNGLDCELFVVDSGSTDRTVAIAESAGAVVVSHPFENYAAQRNWAQQHLPIRTEWVLHLDADERLTHELVLEINDVFACALRETDGFLLRKRTVFMGRWIKHGGHYPSYHLRLFRNERGSCEDRLYDQHFLVRGKVERLRNDYIDVLTPDLTRWTQRHSRWAELEAEEIMSQRQPILRVRPLFWGTPIERRRWLRDDLYARSPLFIRAFLYWFYRYFVRLGFLDGTEGLIFHFLQGCWYRCLVDAKIYERRKLESANPGRGV
jgi:glycosyltransferase involved in cell wall biosynthesis